jgi:DNA-binding NarL/FixJ family response regulator
MQAQVEKPELLIVDSKRLRQAAVMRLLATWADPMGLTAKSVFLDDPFRIDHIPVDCQMIIISVGSASIEDAYHLTLIGNVRSLMPHYASLVIISDREEPQEICAAFQGGANGFIPTSIEPAVAFQALSFIRSGGSYFPPSVLSALVSEVPIRRPVHKSDLTIKQEEVFGLLCQGHSNKVIAHRLGISEAAVKKHTHQIMQKFGVINRTQLAIAAMNQSSLTAADAGKERCLDQAITRKAADAKANVGSSINLFGYRKAINS